MLQWGRTLLPAVIGWLLFVYWWRRVALGSTATAATIAVMVLIVITVSVFFSTLLWIRHNITLAQRGKRGFSTRYLAPNFERDWLDRPLVFLGPVVDPREVTWFVVDADSKEKRFALPSARLSS